MKALKTKTNRYRIIVAGEQCFSTNSIAQAAMCYSDWKNQVIVREPSNWAYQTDVLLMDGDTVIGKFMASCLN